MRVYFHEAGLLEELRYRLHQPAALLIVLPNGLVKLINALPFVCGDLRTRVARRRSGRTSSARGATRASPSSSTTSPRSRQDAHAAPMGPSVSYRADVRRATPRAAASPAARRRRWCATGSSSTRGCCPTCSARRGPTRIAGTFDARDLLERPRRRRAGRRSASKRSTSTSTRAWAPTACSIPADLPPISDAVFWCGVVAFAARARRRASTSTLHVGWPILVFALLGGMAAIFYEAPPIRWSYRGLGETGDRALVRAVDGARQPLPAHARAVVGRVRGVARAGTAHHVARGRERDPRLPPGPARRQAQPRRAPRPRRRACALYLALAAARTGRRARRRRSPASFRWRASPRCFAAAAARRERARRASAPTTTPRAFLPAMRAIVACYVGGRRVLFIAGHRRAAAGRS